MTLEYIPGRSKDITIVTSGRVVGVYDIDGNLVYEGFSVPEPRLLKQASIGYRFGSADVSETADKNWLGGNFPNFLADLTWSEADV